MERLLCGVVFNRNWNGGNCFGVDLFSLVRDRSRLNIVVPNVVKCKFDVFMGLARSDGVCG